MLALLLAACSSNGTVAPPGDPARFDPVADVAGVAAFAGEGARLVAIDAVGVRSDGTVDLTADLPFSVTYRFERAIPAPADAPPVGAGGSIDGHWHESVDVAVFHPGQLRHQSGSAGDFDYKHKGMERRPSTRPGVAPGPFVDPVHCTMAGVWAGLSAAGAPSDAVAMVRLSSSGWSASITDTDFRFERADDCGPEAPGQGAR